MAILRRRGSSMGRVRQRAVPVAQRQRAVAAQTKAPVAQRTGIAPAPAQKMPGAPVAPNGAAQATAMQQFNQSQQGAMNRANSVAQFNQGQQAAMQQFNAANMANISKASQVPATPQQNVALLQAAKVAAAQNAQRTGVAPAPAAQVPQTPSKAMQSYMAAEKAGTAGNMAKPAFRKGGAVKKKPGYAKGGMVMANCGASMKPQQKAKK